MCVKLGTMAQVCNLSASRGGLADLWSSFASQSTSINELKVQRDLVSNNTFIPFLLMLREYWGRAGRYSEWLGHAILQIQCNHCNH